MPELSNTRFGNLSYAEDDLMTFPEGLIGFSHCRQFVIVSTGKGSFRWLQSVDEPPLAFLVVDPCEYVEGYALELGDDEAASLGITERTSTLLFTTASIPASRPKDMTINLAGPIVINADTRTGRQLVVDGEGYSVKHRVFEEEKKAA